MRYSETNYLLPHLKRVIDKLDIDVVIDVGANTGQTVDELRSLGFDGHIVSFEPTPHLFAELVVKYAEDPFWHGHQLALGSTAGELTLNRYREESLNSFLSPSDFGAQRFKTMSEPVVGTTTVRVAALDDLRSELPVGRTLLKIDTQGFDMEVLAGASEFLDETLAILTEVPVNPIYEGMPVMSEVFAWMERHGFQLSGLFPVTRDRQRLRLIEGNCMFIRSSAAE
ncbi:FkbM family methyltransferase [soil metagenome]